METRAPNSPGWVTQSFFHRCEGGWGWGREAKIAALNPDQELVGQRRPDDSYLCMGVLMRRSE